IAAGDVVKAKKPAPDIYTYALEQMNLSADSCVALEDSAMGLRSARDAGINSIIITANGYTLSHDFSGATTVVDHLGEPGKPFHYLSGMKPAGDMIDLAGIQQLHSGVVAEAG
ncbi:phosphatase, partial [Solemya velum gill symbiont]